MSGGRAARRTRFASMAAALLVAASVCAVLLNFIAAARPVRLDMTATGEHRLSPRTLRVLGALGADCRVVVAAPLRSLDAASLERVRDVLGQFERASPRVRPVFIDTGAPAGLTQYTSLLRELTGRDRELIDGQVKTLRGAITTLNDLAGDFENVVSGVLMKVRGGIPDVPGGKGAAQREALEQRAAGARIAARELRRAATEAGEALDSKVGEVAVPATDRAAAVISAGLGSGVDQLSSLAAELKAFVEAEDSPATARDSARPLVNAINKRRDASAVIRDEVARLPRLDLLRVAEALKSSSAVLVISASGGLTAIDPAGLFPASLTLDAAGLARADLRRRAEELLSTALAALTSRARPIVVFMHAEPREFALKSPVFAGLLERLRLRGIDVLEWPVAVQAEPPSLAAVDPERERPVVYASIAPNTSAAASGPGDASGADRAVKLGQALEGLAQKGSAILLSVNPSLLPGYGQPDPTTAILPQFGFQADSARPLVRERITPQGRIVETDQIVRPPAGEQPILRAIAGLPTYLTWPVCFRRVDAAPIGPVLTDLAVIPDDRAVWCESQWLRAWQTPREQLPYLRDLPVFDESRDVRGGPWVVAVAAERAGPDGRTQRLVAVGSNTWFTDPIAAVEQLIEGRTFNPFPGNHELFESAVYWLCGQDELIAQTPAARAFPMVREISAARLGLLRWLVIAGVPVLVLLAGVVHRIVRG
ncbi:MAG: hypothetical protein IT436_14485 [Phycisphaerales bacterium]|nr:hypothetical protein [Phycisphaerales bacterium]